MTIPTMLLKQVIKQIYPQAKLQKVWQLTGGISALTMALEITHHDDTTQWLVLRQHGETDRALNPQIASDEYRLLKILSSELLPVPQPIAFDLSSEILSTPYVLIQYINGKTDPDNLPDSGLIQLVTSLVAIHKIDLTQHDLSFLPRQRAILEQYLNFPPSEHNQIYDILKRAYSKLKHNTPTLLHGDYWLGNIIWDGDRLVGIIDWEDAMLGDPLSDLGKSRLELTWAIGESRTSHYTEFYRRSMSHIDIEYLPFWDLWGASRLSDFEDWSNDSARVSRMKHQYDTFVDHAYKALVQLISK